MRRTATAFVMGLRQYLRTPVLLVLLVAAPVYVIALFAAVVPSTPIAVPLDPGTVQAGADDVVGVMMTPFSGALIGGLTGLFLMRTTRHADRRLVLAGYRAGQLVLARLLLLATVGAVTTAVSVVTLLVAGTPPGHLGWLAVGTLLTALLYGMIGLVVGTVVSTLAGVYVLLFIPMIDVFLFQNPLATDPGAIASWLPAHHPTELIVHAAFANEVSLTPLLPSVGVVALATALAAAVFLAAVRPSK